MEVCNCSMFFCTLLYVHSSIAIILMGKRELIVLLNLSSWCLVMVERLFLAVPRGCLQFVFVVFPDHTHLLFFIHPLISVNVYWVHILEKVTIWGLYKNLDNDKRTCKGQKESALNGRSRDAHTRYLLSDLVTLIVIMPKKRLNSTCEKSYKYNYRIISKTYAHLQARTKTYVKIQRNRHNTVVGVAYTIYLVSIHIGRENDYII